MCRGLFAFSKAGKGFIMTIRGGGGTKTSYLKNIFVILRLFREEQLRILENKSWVKNIDFNKVYTYGLYEVPYCRRVSYGHEWKLLIQ